MVPLAVVSDVKVPATVMWKLVLPCITGLSVANEKAFSLIVALPPMEPRSNPPVDVAHSTVPPIANVKFETCVPLTTNVTALDAEVWPLQ